MGDNDADQTANSGDTQNPSPNGSTGEKPVKFLPQPQVDEIIKKEKAAVARSYEEKLKAYEATAQELAELRAEKQKADEAKLSAAERATREQQRRDEATAKERADLTARAERAERRRIDEKRSTIASRKASTLAARLSSPELAEDVAEKIAHRIVVRDDGKGGDLVLFRMSDAEDDVEPFEEGFKKWEAAGSLNRFMRQATGSGAQHGSGSGGGGAMPSNLVDALAEGARRRAGR